MQFPIDRICCNAHRARIGLACDPDRRFACATHQLSLLCANEPHKVEAFLQPLFGPIPADVLLAACRSLNIVSEWTAGAALYCAARPTKDERRNFFEYLRHYLSDAEYEALYARHDAQWHQLRARRAPRPK
ncbi:hypothetical protein BGLT_06779 [Caballeronia glathei]|uniref:Uncharacterized protein n=1 Tax=Caballeronia glathei TaxID=60547 RepID=A0A069PLA2_9BURK|nr:hypothetical protein [Caballeronia glathei]KDR41147.1 hypothetical protein BG61_20775 [Caballeronia glathei]CDY77973.1 hypothetical protein BGLT_06779 [Caballeronia glathei]